MRRKSQGLCFANSTSHPRTIPETATFSVGELQPLIKINVSLAPANIRVCDQDKTYRLIILESVKKISQVKLA